MHYFKNLCSFAVFSTLIAATVASPAPAPGADAKGVVSPAPDTASVQSPHPGAKKFTLETQGPTPEVAAQFIGVLIMYTTSGCAAGGSSETWEIYGYPGAYGCLPVPAGWVTESVTFSQGIGDIPGCYATTWSTNTCAGPSMKVPLQECLTIPYAGVSVQCAS